MAVIAVRYKPDNKSFGKMMRSDQTQDLADQGARRGVLEAQQIAIEAGLDEAYVYSIKAESGPLVLLGGNLRRTARVVAKDRRAGAIEFGSGQKRPRPQGGRSRAYRVLGQAGAKVGSAPVGGVG